MKFFFNLYLTATNNKEFTSSLTSFCGESSEKKIRLEHHISQTEKCCESEDRSDWFTGFWRRNYRQTRSRFHSWIDYLKSEPVYRFCNLLPVSNCSQMIGEFLTAIFSKRWNGKYANVWDFYLDILQIQENWVGRNIITNSRVY